jgi:hypothetical protein
LGRGPSGGFLERSAWIKAALWKYRRMMRIFEKPVCFPDVVTILLGWAMLVSIALGGYSLWESQNLRAQLLETVGMPARAFASPQSFLAQVSALSPGCLVLDIRMPMISGLKLQERIKHSGVSRPAVTISGHGDIDAARARYGLDAIGAD